MIKHDKLHLPDRRRARAVAAATLASMSLGGAAQAQPSTGGTEAAPEVTRQGGVQAESPDTAMSELTPAEQELEAKVQKDKNRLARAAFRLDPGHKHKPTPEPGVNGSTIAHTTIPINSQTKGGLYTFDVYAPVGKDGRTPNLNRVDTVTFTQTVENKAGDLVTFDMLTMDTNPRSGHQEISGYYEQVYGKKTDTETMDATIHPLNEVQPLTELEWLAASGQMKFILRQAHGRKPVIDIQRAFNQEGETVLDPPS